MFKRIIVPTDGSDFSWRAVEVGEALARQCDAELQLLEVVSSAADVMRAEEITRERLAEAPVAVPVSVCARVLQRSVGCHDRRSLRRRRPRVDRDEHVRAGPQRGDPRQRGTRRPARDGRTRGRRRAEGEDGPPRLPRRTDRARRRLGVLRDGAAARRRVGHRVGGPPVGRRGSRSRSGTRRRHGRELARHTTRPRPDPPDTTRRPVRGRSTARIRAARSRSSPRASGRR